MDYIIITISAIALITLGLLFKEVLKIKNQNEQTSQLLFSQNQEIANKLELCESQILKFEEMKHEELKRKIEEQKYQFASISNQITGVIDAFNNLLQVQSAQNAETAKELGLMKGSIAGMKEQWAVQIERMQKTTEDKLASFEILQKISISNMTETVKASIENLQEVQKQSLMSTKESTRERLESMDEKIIGLSQSLGENIKLLTQRTSENIAKLESTLTSSIVSLKSNVDENLKYMNKENQKELERMRIIVDEKLTSTLEARLNSSFNVINNSLEQVYKGLGDVQSLTKGVGDLKNVLQNVKTRGTWAEVQLDNLLSQMLTPKQYCKQAIVDTNSSERVDFGILLPGKDQEIIIPIDSKFPIEDYHRLISASENGDKDAVMLASKKLEDAIKVQANSISQKYIKPPKTTDFAVMYLPLEGLYAEVLRNSSLVESLQRDKRIVIAGPSTLGAILNSLQMGFRTLEIEKRSGEIYDLLAVFKKEFLKFSEILDKTQKKINEASNQIELASRRTRTIGRKLRDVTSENSELAAVEKGLLPLNGEEIDA
ncbi:MAG: DNA recombination protein RmuC [Bacillota bacterium]